MPRAGPLACPHEVGWALHLRPPGACPVAAGEVVGFPRVLGPGRLQTVRRWAEITDKERPPGPDNVATHHEVTTTWVLKDGTFVVEASQDSAGICHHCGIPRCRRVPAEPSGRR